MGASDIFAPDVLHWLRWRISSMLLVEINLLKQNLLHAIHTCSLVSFRELHKKMIYILCFVRILTV